jgi:hypothetical protein
MLMYWTEQRMNMFYWCIYIYIYIYIYIERKYYQNISVRKWMWLQTTRTDAGLQVVQENEFGPSKEVMSPHSRTDKVSSETSIMGGETYIYLQYRNQIGSLMHPASRKICTGRQCARSMTLTTHLHLVPWPRTRGLRHHISCTPARLKSYSHMVNFTFIFTVCCISKQFISAPDSGH